MAIRKLGYPAPPGNGKYNAMDSIEEQVGLNRFMNGQGSYGTMTQPDTYGYTNPKDFVDGFLVNGYDGPDGPGNDFADPGPLVPFGRGTLQKPIVPEVKATVAKANAPRKSKGRTKARREVNKAVKDVGVPGNYNFNAAGQRMPDDWAGPSKGSMNPFARDFDPSALFGGDRRVNDARMPGGRGAYGFNENDPVNLF